MNISYCEHQVSPKVQPHTTHAYKYTVKLNTEGYTYTELYTKSKISIVDKIYAYTTLEIVCEEVHSSGLADI